MPYYTVYGKRYYIMKSPRNFVQTGMASWYGTKFHSRRTSSGEKYDMLAMTAAHKTLPLPTYVEVTNLKNHRQIIVKVNDRGPFSSNRIIDLSYVAAKKLECWDMALRGYKLKRSTPMFMPASAKKPLYPAPLLITQRRLLLLTPLAQNVAQQKPSFHIPLAHKFICKRAFSKKAYALNLKSV